MLTYLIEASLCWAVFYGFYAALLSRTTFFRHNRWYLLVTLVLGLIIPWAELPAPVAPATEQLRNVYLAPVTAGIEMLEITVKSPPENQRAVDAWLLLSLLYLAGVALAAARFGYGLWQLGGIYRGSQVVRNDEYTLVLTGKPHLPFSFFRLLFLSNTLPSDDPDSQVVLRHEQTHIRQGHSYDVLLLELLSILFWCSPFVYFYRRALTTVHEYLADAAVLRDTRKKQYGHLLIRQSHSGMPVALANHFAQTQLKKRIIMMTRHRTPGAGALRYALAIPLTLLLLLAFANQELISQTILEIRKPGGIIEKLEFADDAEMKQHVGKMDPNDIEMMDVRKGEQNHIIITLREHLNGEDEGVISGKAPSGGENGVKLRPDPDRPVQLEIHRPGAPVETIEFASQEEVKQQLDKIDPKDIETVDVRKGDPDRIVIKLRNGGDSRRSQVREGDMNAAMPGLQTGDHPPRFPGCEDLADPAERLFCSQQKTIEFLSRELQYPADAKAKKIEGVVVISFTVYPDGKLNTFQILKSPDPSLSVEAMRVLGSMPAWIPAEKDGKAAAYEMKLPITFKLSAGGGEKILPGVAPREKVHQTVDEMPRFPGCEGLADAAERQNCAQRELLKFVFSQVRYPEEARKAGIEGTAVVRFVVDKEGSIVNPQVVRSLGGGTDEELLRILKAMPRWTPGSHNGEPAAVEFNLPVNFKLSDGDEAAANTTPAARPEGSLELRTFNLAPNPSSGHINLRFEADAAPTTIRVTDLAGRELFRRQLNDFDGHYQSTIDLSSAARGTVLLIVQQGDKVYSEKVVLR